jgi:hypothetical protein
MRILIAGDWRSQCNGLAERIVAPLLKSYGRDIAAVSGGAPGVDGLTAQGKCDQKIQTRSDRRC